MTKRDVESATKSWLAGKVMADVQDYVARGRKLSEFSEGDLQRLYVAAVEKWAECVTQPPRMYEDVKSEYSLRGIDPPIGTVQGTIEIIIREIGMHMENATQEQKDAFNKDVFAASNKEIESKN